MGSVSAMGSLNRDRRGFGTGIMDDAYFMSTIWLEHTTTWRRGYMPKFWPATL